jgi:predicted deacylase
MLSSAVIAQKSFEFAGHSIKPGEKKSIMLPIKAISGDSTFIPITIVHGTQTGPVLGLIAGIHGYEYPPIMALQKLRPSLNGNDLKGTVIMVHIANVKAFFGRSVFYNPVDGKNVNRLFPGNKSGTLSDVIAHTITTEIISRCQYLVDIHAGDANEDLHPYVAYYNYGTQTAKAKQLADALNFPWVIISENLPKPGQPTIYCSAESVSHDIATVAIEYGKLGQVTSEEASFIQNRLLNMMMSIGMLRGAISQTSPAFEIRKRTSIVSNHSGIFYPVVKSGELVKKGTKLGLITGLFGEILEEIVSPVNGFVIYLSVTPPINKGETLFSLASFE